MQDTVIKGNGRSRIIKGPADMPATYEEWRAQVMAGTAQLDVSVNPDTTESGGISQLGTPLNKANLLTDEVAALFGLMDDATIDAMFRALWSLRAAKNGFATLDSSGKVPSTQLRDMIEEISIRVIKSFGTITKNNIKYYVIGGKIGILNGSCEFETTEAIQNGNIQIYPSGNASGKVYIPDGFELGVNCEAKLGEVSDPTKLIPRGAVLNGQPTYFEIKFWFTEEDNSQENQTGAIRIFSVFPVK